VHIAALKTVKMLGFLAVWAPVLRNFSCLGIGLWGVSQIHATPMYPLLIRSQAILGNVKFLGLYNIRIIKTAPLYNPKQLNFAGFCI
jgi:hypothetical protein